ncbi:MAG: alanyl-tRNA editing protein [Acidobacteriota bacterium]|nr:alanyl-tRNA editing protein [Acidobacteriota bacterium]
MTERLYHQNSFLYDFTASLAQVRPLDGGRQALIFDHTAFYPLSGGQRADRGWIEFVDAAGSPLAVPKVQVVDVVEEEATGDVLHIVEAAADVPEGAALRGFIDVELRQDHMQQHSGQHVLSACFLRLFAAATASFHMGEESCTIDLAIPALTPTQLEQAELLANQMVWEDRQVLMHEATPEQARQAGVRKLPEGDFATLRLIEVRGVDLCACCGTHVKTTGQIGHIQLRKVEKFKQGVRVEFVCGRRALTTARRDFQVLTEAAALVSGHIYELPAQVQKLLDSGKAAQKQQQKLQDEMAELAAQQTLSSAPLANGRKIVSAYLAVRDAAYIKLYAQKLTALAPNVIALLGAGEGTPALVFAQSPGAGFNAGAELKTLVTATGGRGGGAKDFAQGSVPSAELIPELLSRAEATARALPEFAG